MKKKAIASVLSGVLALQMLGAMSMSVSADLVSSDNGLRFKLPSGEYVTGWVTKNEHTYYFDSEGYALMGWYSINDAIYYFDANGVMADGLVEINGTLRYFEDGKMVKREFVEYNNATYYVSSTGKVAVGWRYLDNNYYYFNEDGTMELGWKQLDGKYYYFGTDGKMARNTTVEISNIKYYFNDVGVYTKQESTVAKPVETQQPATQNKPTTSNTNTNTSSGTSSKPTTTTTDTTTDKQDTSVDAPAETLQMLPMSIEMISTIEKGSGTTLNEDGRQAVNKYVRSMILDAMGRGYIDVDWYYNFVVGAYDAAGASMTDARKEATYDALVSAVSINLENENYESEEAYWDSLYHELVAM